MKKITLATVKSFIKANRDQLYISFRSSFDGMIDCVSDARNKSFQIANTIEAKHENEMGIKGAWFVKQSRDYFRAYTDGIFSGIEVSNSCGSFILAVKRGDNV